MASHESSIKLLDAAEDAYTQALAEFAKQQFHQSAISSALAQDTSQFQWVDLVGSNDDQQTGLLLLFF